jgi:NADPH-dependent 2,4-dienoyl-CoA reductase/sulfur reductase-like enzyme
MTPRHLVVVGASLAGLRAVEAARKAGFDGEVTLIGAEAHLPYDRPPLSKAYLEEIATGDEPAPTTFRDEAYFRDELAVELVLGHPARSLDIGRKVVVVGEREIPYDALVIATGADPRTLPGTEGLRGVHSLRTLDDAVAIRAALEARAKVVVIGAGFIGAELAATASKRGLSPVILEAMTTPLVRAVGEQMGEALASLHYRNGTDLRCGVGVKTIEGDGHVERVVLDDGTVIPADLVVVGVGTIPTTGWLEGSGLELDNGVVCDENLFTGVDGVYAAGDIARWQNPVFDRLMRLEHWTSAAEQGAVAACNAIDPDSATAYSTIPYFWSDQYDVRIQFVGVNDSDEVVVVDGDLDSENRLVALYRKGDTLVGALAIQGQTEIMKYRGMVARQAPWQEALDFAAARKAARAERLAAGVSA